MLLFWDTVANWQIKKIASRVISDNQNICCWNVHVWKEILPKNMNLLLIWWMLRARSIYFKPFIYAAVGCKTKMKTIDVNTTVTFSSNKCVLIGISWFTQIVGFYINTITCIYTHPCTQSMYSQRIYLNVPWKLYNPRPQLYLDIKHCWIVKYLKC